MSKIHPSSALEVRTPQGAEVLRAFDQTVRVLLPAALSQGTLMIADVEVPAHNGPPPHVHHAEDEIFLVQSGSFEFWIDGECVEVGAGDCVYGPRDVPHTFVNLGDETATLRIISVNAGFESFFRQCADVWGTPDAMPQIMAIAQAHQLEFVEAASVAKVGVPANGKTPRVVRAGEGEELATPNGRGHIWVSERDTAGDFALGELEFAPLSGTPYQVHRREHEVLMVQSGVFECSSNGQTYRAQAGDVVWLPRDVPHSIRCISGEAGEIIVLFVPGAVAGYYREAAALFAEGQLDSARFKQVGARYGIEVLTPVI